MVNTKENITQEYTISGIKYIVRSTVTTNAKEDAAKKIRRLIRNEISAEINRL